MRDRLQQNNKRSITILGSDNFPRRGESKTVDVRPFYDTTLLESAAPRINQNIYSPLWLPCELLENASTAVSPLKHVSVRGYRVLTHACIRHDTSKEKYKLQNKRKEKYLKKKEKGLIKTVDQMTPREQRKARKIWKKKAKSVGNDLLQNVTNIPAVPSTSDVDDQLPQRISQKALAAKLNQTEQEDNDI
ncbi:hypothetical protein EVAR_82746_1 [Eumeta japonica]|uniref:Uncharacterized protein n=1 Tax=Eumeta variegata TaxID=151549 RepID=A0A4C2A4P0_EUMVA|nr:hypothetical protein EVAR_82746_1 [Eumeta japonica]